MELTTLTTILVVLAPTVSAIFAIIGATIKFLREVKKLQQESDKKLSNSNIKLVKMYDNIAKINTKVASIEKHLLEKENK